MIRIVKYLRRSVIVRVLLIILALEGISAALIYVRFDWARDTENPDFLERFSFTHTFVRPFMPHRYAGLREICDNPVDFRNPLPWVATRLFPPDPVYGYRMGRNQCARRKNSVIMTNDQGFSAISSQPTSYSLEKDAGTFRVIVLGGSTVMGLGALRPEGNLPAQVQRRIREVAGNDLGVIEVINGGVGGYYSVTEFLYLASELVHYGPDLVIVYDGWNDFQFRAVNSRQSLHGTRAASNDLILRRGYTFFGSLGNAAGTLVLISKAIVERSTTLFLARLLLTRLPGGGPDQPMFSDSERTETVLRQGLDRYERNLRLMVATAEIHDFDIALFLQPLLFVQPGHEERLAYFLAARRMFEQMQTEFSSNSAVCVGDLSHALDGEEAAEVYYDTGHLLTKGNEIVSAALVGRLGECGFFAAPAE